MTAPDRPLPTAALWTLCVHPPRLTTILQTPSTTSRAWAVTVTTGGVVSRRVAGMLCARWVSAAAVQRRKREGHSAAERHHSGHERFLSSVISVISCSIRPGPWPGGGGLNGREKGPLLYPDQPWELILCSNNRMRQRISILNECLLQQTPPAVPAFSPRCSLVRKTESHGQEGV